MRKRGGKEGGRRERMRALGVRERFPRRTGISLRNVYSISQLERARARDGARPIFGRRKTDARCSGESADVGLLS